MLKLLAPPDLPDQVIALRAEGMVTAEDYEKLLIPMVEKKLAQYGKVRFLYHLGSQFHHFTPKAFWDDTKVGLTHWTQWERIAVVTDVKWLRKVVAILGYLLPNPVKVFHNNELDTAFKWICA